MWCARTARLQAANRAGADGRVPRFERLNGIADTAENDCQLVIKIMRGSSGHGVGLIGFR
jgi:hypothetical protein